MVTQTNNGIILGVDHKFAELAQCQLWEYGKRNKGPYTAPIPAHEDLSPVTSAEVT